MAPSSFASAAAGNSSQSTRPEGIGGEWTRRANGATQTFRRPSQATSLSSSAHQRDASATSNAAVYVPPHASFRNGPFGDERYSKDQLLTLFREQKENNTFAVGLSDLYVGGWEPLAPNGAASSWGKREDQAKDVQPGADICWDHHGNVEPLGILQMTDEEKELFTSSVNSTLKPPQQTTNKEGTSKDGLSLRKSSVSHGQSSPGGFGLTSPTSARPLGRRRETSDSFPFPREAIKSENSRFAREDSHAATPPPALLRRRTDFKESSASPSVEEGETQKKEGDFPGLAGLGTLRRTVTTGANGPTSPWSATSPTSGFSPMGAFSNLGLGAQASEKRPAFGSMRSESRFKGLLSKDVQETKEAEDRSTLSKLTENSEVEAHNSNTSWPEAQINRAVDDDEAHSGSAGPSGSAALGGGIDSSPARTRSNFFGLGTPSKNTQADDAGFSAFGMTADSAAFRDGHHNRQEYLHQTPHQRPTEHSHEPMSPTTTNPYQSPDHDRRGRHEDDGEASHMRNQQSLFGHEQHSALPGLGGFGAGRAGHGHDLNASDRSQTSSTGPQRGFPSLSSLGGLPGLGTSSAWSNQPSAMGTINQDRRFGDGFGDIGFANSGDAQSMGLSGLGSSAPFGGLGASGTIGRANKMTSVFPPTQDTGRGMDARGPADDNSAEAGERQHGALSQFGRVPFSAAPGSAVPARDAESPFRSGRGLLEEALAARSSYAGSASSPSAPLQTPIATGPIQPSTVPTGPHHQSVSSNASNQPPALQQRTMVMPDRMRWVYKDPQGNSQGPWSGLEMHEWCRGGFFSPDLQVKKEEDVEYEPLAHLIRRIGNSREPFLVPQIGIPHGPVSAQPSSSFTPSASAASVTAPSTAGGTGGTQPPFAGSFPSFGTTLTAEQQNALERRKQEEQYLMAKQKEHLAQQQMIAKQMHIQQGLHHHGSAHSLQSQPSYGSITSPGGFQQSPAQPGPGASGMPGFFDTAFQQQRNPMPPGPQMGMAQAGQTDDMTGYMDRMNLRGTQPGHSGQYPFSQQQPPSDVYAHQLAAEQRARLQREQHEYDTMQQRLGNDQVAGLESAQRLQDFHDLREEAQTHTGVLEQEMLKQAKQQKQQQEELQNAPFEGAPAPQEYEMSLTEQVQRAQSEKQQRERDEQKPRQAWGPKIETGVPVQPFPPPTSQSPMPAPIAQRKQNLADQLNAESRSQTQTPSADPQSASVAPWAKEPMEQSKGPSLREIQEAEAKKAAEREANEAATRRAQIEKEMMAAAAAAAAVPAPAPGLPSGATWGSGAVASPSSANGSGPSAWTKPLAGKAQSSGPAKKTLQQIQKEEEARKQRAAAAAAVNSASSVSLSGPGGKRYADLAGKGSSGASGLPATSGAWTTVGSSGKPKAPPVPAGPPAVSRSVSGPVLSTKSVASVVTGKVGGPVKDKVNAQEELRRWMLGELKGDLSKGVSADDFVNTLVSLPSEKDLIVEAVHSVSNTLDSRHFAEEFIRRRKLADRGIVDAAHAQTPSPSGHGPAGNAEKQGGGWSEVAKKGPTQASKAEEVNNFRLVAAKKKGGKR